MAYMPDPVIANLLADQLEVGEETVSREACNSTVTGGTTGQLRPVYFTCRKTETTTQVRVYTGSTAAAATPTLCRIGLWTSNNQGALLELVAAVDNDTTLFAASATAYTRSWASPYRKVAGQRYALATLQVSGVTVANFFGNGIGYSAVVVTAPLLAAVPASGLSDLPASAPAPAGGSGGGRLYAELLP